MSRRTSRSRSMTENQRGVSRPAGATGATPASGRSRRSARRSATQPAERVAGDDDLRAAALGAEVRDGVRGEGVELGQHRARRQRRARAEAGQVDREGAAARAGQAVEHRPPRVGRVGVPVQQQQRRAVALELQRPRPGAGELEAVLHQRLHRDHFYPSAGAPAPAGRPGCPARPPWAPRGRPRADAPPRARATTCRGPGRARGTRPHRPGPRRPPRAGSRRGRR